MQGQSKTYVAFAPDGRRWAKPVRALSFMLVCGGVCLTEAGAEEIRQSDEEKRVAVVSRSTPLSPDRFLRQVEDSFPKLLGAELERRSASAKRLEKEGAFAPVVQFTSDYLRYNSTTTPGKGADTTLNEVSVEALTPYGFKVFAGARLNFNKVKSPASSTGTLGEYFVGVKLPLLRGAGINEKRIALQQAQLGEPLAAQNFAVTRLELLLKAATDYWDWAAAGQKVTVARDLLRIARERAEATRERANRGDLPGIDSVEADQEVQRRLGNLTKAERDLAKAAFKLQQYLWQPDGTPESAPTSDRLPGELPAPSELNADVRRQGQRRALENRPELKSITLARASVQLDLHKARNDRLPAVDLVFSPGIDTGSRSVGETLKAGVLFSLPLNQRAADGRIADAQLKIQKLTLEERLQRQRIVIEVDDAVSAINTTYQRYLAAREELQKALTLAQGERDRLAAGDSTLFLVNQRERAAAEAAVKVIEVQAEYQQALAAYRAVTVAL